MHSYVIKRLKSITENQEKKEKKKVAKQFVSDSEIQQRLFVQILL